MGLMDYYKQFEDLDQEEVNRELRAKNEEEKRKALARVPTLDLSSTEWPDLPNADVVNAAIATARGRVNSYPDGRSTRLREAIAQRHELTSDQVVVGNGSAELMQAAAFLLLHPGDEMLIPWPSYVIYPVIAHRAGAQATLVELAEGQVSVDALLAAITPATRIIVLCNPNDPTGTYLPASEIARLAAATPDHVHVLVDEAFIQFQDVEDENAVLRLVETHEQLLVFRTFSKVYGLSGLRIGYAIGAAAESQLLQSIGPALGVNTLSESAARQSLAIGDREIAKRRATVLTQRARLWAAMQKLPLDGPQSQANFVWLRSPGMTGLELAARLKRSSVIVAAGEALGDSEHVRAAVRSEAAMNRLIAALERAF